MWSNMRMVPSYEKKQRGCQYCTNMQLTKFDGDSRTSCPFDTCPFSVLDKYKTYEEFLASEDSKIYIDEYFTTVGWCYALQNANSRPNRKFSDGDDKVHL